MSITTTAIVSLIVFGCALQCSPVCAARRVAHESGTNSLYYTSTQLRSSKVDAQHFEKHAGEQAKRTAAQKKRDEEIERARDNHKGLLILNSLVMDAFIEPTFMVNSQQDQRTGKKRRSFSEIPMAVGRVLRGLTNLTVTIGRTINSENVNGSLSRLITNRLVGVSESMMGWVERSVGDLPSIPRLDPQECMKRIVCEAHSQPKKYGAIGLVIQLFFPPYLDLEDTNKVVSKYQLAARYGRGENANCSAQYDDCMVNILDVLQGAIDMIF